MRKIIKGILFPKVDQQNQELFRLFDQVSNNILELEKALTGLHCDNVSNEDFIKHNEKWNKSNNTIQKSINEIEHIIHSPSYSLLTLIGWCYKNDHKKVASLKKYTNALSSEFTNFITLHYEDRIDSIINTRDLIARTSWEQEDA